MQWKPEEESLLHVVPLDGNGPVRSFKAPKYFTFHYMNAYESGKDGLVAVVQCCLPIDCVFMWVGPSPAYLQDR